MSNTSQNPGTQRPSSLPGSFVVPSGSTSSQRSSAGGHVLAPAEDALGPCVEIEMLVDGSLVRLPASCADAAAADRVAACSHGARLLSAMGGVSTSVCAPESVGRAQLVEVLDLEAAKGAFLHARAELEVLSGAGSTVVLRELPPRDKSESTLVLVEIRGTSSVDLMARTEAVGARAAELVGARLGVVSSIAESSLRIVEVRARVPVASLGVSASVVSSVAMFAQRDPADAARRNAEVVDSVSCILRALGQDRQAIEAAVHAFASRSGAYTTLSCWDVDGDMLVGRIRIPLPGGSACALMNAPPLVRDQRRASGAQSSDELASFIAAAALASDLAALKEAAMKVAQRHAAAHRASVESPPESRVMPTVDPKPSPIASDADRAFCDAALPGVSRTFALSIQALPAALRDAICVAYLLCRVVDTVEDDRSKTPAVRGALFDAFDAALGGARQQELSAVEAFADGCVRAGLGPTQNEKDLCKNAGAIFRVFAALPEVQREAIYPSVAEMSRGMRSYSERADAEGGLKLRDVEDLEKYCYYVAGTVGELLTALFRVAFPVSEPLRGELEARAVSFGLGLQLVNILKDVAEDAVRGDCFLPQKQAAEHGLDLKQLLTPSERPKGLALLRSLSARARHHLERAEEYTTLWPASAREVRLFCAVPLALALATLREVELGDDALLPNRAPTVSRALVMKVFEDAMSATTDHGQQHSDQLLHGLFDRARTGAVTRPARPAATLARGSAAQDRPREGVTMSEAQSSSTPNSSSGGLQPRRQFGGKVLVTGAAGHVGANLVHRLLTEDRDVRVFLREGSDNSAIDAIEAATGKKVERVFGDLRSPREIAPAVQGCETVFHVAARVSTLSGKPQDLRDLYACNVLGTANLLRAAGDAGVQKTVVTGSLSAVGFDIDDPSKVCDESMPFYPFLEHLPYGRTKSLVEHEVLKAAVDGQDVVIATSCAVLGPWDYKPSRMGRTLQDFANGKLNAYLPGGFDFVATRDLVDGHLLAMERGRRGHRYILSTEFATVDNLMEIFEEASGRPRPKLRLPANVMAGVAHVTSFVMSTFFPTKPQRFTPAAVRLLRMERKVDTTKAQTELGYKPTNIRSAIHEAYADFARRGLVPQSPSLGRSEEAKAAISGSATPSKSREGAAA